MSIALQLLVNSLISGLVLALMAMGFHLAFRTAKVFHLAHGAVFVLGAYIAVAVSGWTPGVIGWVVAFTLALIGSGLMAWCMDRWVYRRLNAKGAGQEISLVASMGVYLFLTEALAWGFGNQAHSIDPPFNWTLDFTVLLLSSAQVLQAVVALFVIGYLIRLFKGERCPACADQATYNAIAHTAIRRKV